MKGLLITLILVSFNPAIAWVIEGSVSPHHGTTETEIALSYVINNSYTGKARLKICLDEYDFNNLKYDYDCDILLREVNITMPEPGQEIFKLNQPSWLYRFCLKLYANGSTYSDCDNDNTFFLNNQYYEQPVDEDKPLLIVSVYAPEYVMQNHEFTSYVNINNQGSDDREVLVYSYAYNGSTIMSEGFINSWKKSWTANQKRVVVPRLSSATVSLINRINNSGFFDYNVRVKFGDESIDTRKKINVSEEKIAIASIDSISYDNQSLIVCTKNLGAADANVTLKLFSYNLSIEESFLVSPKRTVEKNFTIPDLGFVHVLLLVDKSIIDEEGLTIDYANEVVQEDFLINKTANVAEQTQIFSIETVLYSITVTICLAGVYLLVRKV